MNLGFEELGLDLEKAGRLSPREGFLLRLREGSGLSLRNRSRLPSAGFLSSSRIRSLPPGSFVYFEAYVGDIDRSLHDFATISQLEETHGTTRSNRDEKKYARILAEVDVI
jgi:hypothetical protein